MYLGNPSIPISIDLDKAKDIVEQALKKRNWKDISIESGKILFVSYYFFEYSCFDEEERQGEKLVKNVQRGRLVLNPETNEIMEGVAEQLPKEGEMQHELPEFEEFEVKKPSLKAKNARKIALLKTAELLEKPAERVEIMDLHLFYIPIWEIKAKVKEQEVTINLSAANGQIIEEEKLPFREKTAGEITRETLNELKEPKAWVKYSKELIQLIRKKRGKGKGVKIKNSWLITIFLIIILLIVIFLL